MVCLISNAVGNLAEFPLSSAVILHCPLEIPVTLIVYLEVDLLNFTLTEQTPGV